MVIRFMLNKIFSAKEKTDQQLAVNGSNFYEESSGYYSVKGEAFSDAYADWRQNKFLSSTKTDALNLALLTTNLENRNGYVREFCLRVLIEKNSTEAFKPIVLRLNDYVLVNRELALQLAMKWLGELPIDQIIDALHELNALEKQSRANFSAVDAVLQSRLDTDDGKNALLAGLKHNNVKVRYVCWRYCLRKFSWNKFERIQAAVNSGDPGIARLVEPDIYDLSDSKILSLFEQIDQIRAMTLRRACLIAIKRKGLREILAISQRALWDDSFSIRGLSRFWLKDSPEFLKAQYLEALATNSSARRKRYALEGLAYLRAADTLDMCVQAMKHNNPGVRKHALIASCSIDKNSCTTYVCDALTDEATSVASQGFRILLEKGDELPFATLQHIARHRCNELTFFTLLLGYAAQLPFWSAMHIASLTQLLSPQLKNELRMHINQLLERLTKSQVYAPPNQEQWKAVSDWRTAEKLHKDAEIQFVMSIYAKRMSSEA